MLAQATIVFLTLLYAFAFRPIHDAADNGKIDSLRLLMSFGADPFISTYSGRSVLECAKRRQTKDYIAGVSNIAVRNLCAAIFWRHGAIYQQSSYIAWSTGS